MLMTSAILDLWQRLAQQVLLLVPFNIIDSSPKTPGVCLEQVNDRFWNEWGNHCQ